MTIIQFLQLLHDSEFGTSIRESLYLFPILEGVHLIGLALSVGLIIATDLRLIGVFLKQVPVSQVLHQLRPYVLTGFLITFVTGVLLLWAEGPRIWEIPVFPLKLALIVVAGLNALWFEFKFGRSVQHWGHQPAFPTGARLAGWISLVSWTSVVILGRLIPYLETTQAPF
ncbi:MAG TPA: DUF6644 family protein [Methylophilus sp.]